MNEPNPDLVARVDVTHDWLDLCANNSNSLVNAIWAGLTVHTKVEYVFIRMDCYVLKD